MQNHFPHSKIFRDRKKLLCLLEKDFPDKKRVFTNGCFDIVHAGHISYLSRARQLGDILIIGLNSDESVQRLKGAMRPVNNWEDRAIVLAAVACVDFVFCFAEDRPIASIELFRPQIHCKGGDYRPEDLGEKATVEKYGGRVEILPFLSGRSSSKIISKIQNLRLGQNQKEVRR